MKYSAEEVAKEIRLAISEGRAIVFENFFEESENPSWEEILQLIHDGYHDKESRWARIPSEQPEYEPAIGRNMFRGRSYVTVRLDSNGDPFTAMQPQQQELSKAVVPAEMMASHVVFSMFGHEKLTETAVHADGVHTFYWQLQGKSNWRFFDDFCCIHCMGKRVFVSQKVVGPGDLLFMPKGMIHTVDITGPRAAAIFRFEHSDETFGTPGALNPHELKEL